MKKNKDIKNPSIPGNNQFKFSDETVENLAELGKEVLNTGKISKEITEADHESTSKYFSSLNVSLNAINQEIKDCVNLDEKSMLYKQREDVMDRMKEEKENQRHYNDNREDKNRSHTGGVIAIVAAAALGAGGYAAKFLLENKKS